MRRREPGEAAADDNDTLLRGRRLIGSDGFFD
jgi:hypothetical protein